MILGIQTLLLTIIGFVQNLQPGSENKKLQRFETLPFKHV